MKRLIDAMGEADRVTLQIKQVIQQAEADAAKILDKEPGESQAAPPALTTASTSGGEQGFFESLWNSLPGPLRDILEGAVAGDFSDRTTALGVIAQIVVGMIPYVGQAADIRDIIANGKDLYDGKEGAGLGLAIAIVAIVPGLDALKVLKPVLKAVPAKAAKELLQEIVSNPKIVKTIGESVVALVKNPTVVETLAKHPDAIIPVLKGGGEIVEQIGKHGDEVLTTMAKYGDDGSYIAKNFDRYVGELANDPAHAGVGATAKSKREAGVGLGLENRGDVPGPIRRDPTGNAEFIDANGTAWDVKGFNSSYPPKKGGFEVNKSMESIRKSLDGGENVMLDTDLMSPAHVAELKKAVTDAGLQDKVRWYP
jgi:hypothetical protein